MPEKIAILKESGETLNTNIVSIFTIPEIQKKFIITTENAVDPHGLTVLHVSEIIGDELSRIATDDEWASIKNIMRSIISGSVGSYQFQPLITSAKAKAQYSRDISVSATACKQIIDSYEAALKNLNKTEKAPSENKEATKEKVEDDKTSSAGSSSIFPSNVNVEDEENEVIPGISEVDEKTPDEKEESPVVITEEASSPTKISVENDEESKEEEASPVVVEDKKEEPTVKDDVEDKTSTEKIEEPEKEEQIVLVEDESPVEETKEETKVVPKTMDNEDLASIIESSKAAFMDDLNELINKIADKIAKEISEKEKKLEEKEALIVEREKLVNGLIANLSNPKDK